VDLATALIPASADRTEKCVDYRTDATCLKPQSVANREFALASPHAEARRAIPRGQRRDGPLETSLSNARQRSEDNMSNQQSGLDIITDSDAFLALRNEWNALWSEADGRHHQAFAVCWLCWTQVAKLRGRRLHCIVYRENGELVLVWPLVSHRRFVWTVLEPLTPGTAEHTSILAAAGASVAIDAAWRAATRHCHADIFTIPYVGKNARLYDLASRHAGLVAATQDVSATALLRKEPDWTAYCYTLGALSKKKPGAREKRFEKEGILEIRILEAKDTHAHAQWVDWMLARKREWAERVEKDGPWLYSQGYRDFLVNLVDGTHTQPMGILFVMTLDGTPVAANIMGLGHTCVNGLIAGFDPKFSKFAPGSIMIERCVRWAWENRMDLDLGVGTEDFKAYWSRGNVLPNTSFQIATTGWGKLAFYAKNLAKKLADMRAARARASADKAATTAQTADPDIAEMRPSLATAQAPELGEA
jgi:CelD/BcsL family acetyltransferase involved in cellulose biosynthesis